MASSRKPRSLLLSLAGLEVMACLFIAAVLVSLVLLGRVSHGAPEYAEDAVPPLCSNVPIQQQLQDALARTLPGGGYDQPPIISLRESQGYHFVSGSAELSDEFKERLGGDVTDRILEIANYYGLDVIEVIGHTDEVPVGTAASNLDAHLLPFLRGEAPVQQLSFSDNAGLGIARAAAVVKEIRKNPRLLGFSAIPLSAGQAVLSDGSLASGADRRGSEEDRRRIEIRLRHSIVAGQPSVAEVAADDGAS